MVEACRAQKQGPSSAAFSAKSLACPQDTTLTLELQLLRLDRLHAAVSSPVRARVLAK